VTADRLATPEDLASLLERDDIDAYKAGVLVEIATAIVQEAAGGQRIVQVTDDQVAIEGTTDSWLALPQLPVTAVSSVVLDGVTLTTAANDYKVVGNRLWRRLGWQTNWGWPIDWPYPVWGVNGTPFNWQGMLSEPSVCVVTYTHGYVPGAQQLQMARGAVLSICKAAYGNPQGLSAESIDDYSVTYNVLSAQLEASPYLKAAIRRQYGRRAGLVRIG
jgi:hypothetical protein